MRQGDLSSLFLDGVIKLIRQYKYCFKRKWFNDEESVGIVSFIYYIDDNIFTNRTISFSYEDDVLLKETVEFSYKFETKKTFYNYCAFIGEEYISSLEEEPEFMSYDYISEYDVDDFLEEYNLI